MSETKTVAGRWTRELVEDGWTPVSDYFLANYHRLKISSLEAMVIVHLVSFKWGATAPFPAIGTLATRMGMTPGAVRAHLRNLGKKHLLIRELKAGGTNRFYLEPLFNKLSALQEHDRRLQQFSNPVAAQVFQIDNGIASLIDQLDLKRNTLGEFTGEWQSKHGVLSTRDVQQIIGCIAENQVTGFVGSYLWKAL